MAEDNNDMMDSHLRSLLPDQGLDRFKKQLPDDFLQDASDGLERVNDSKQLELVLKQLNQQMHQQLSHKKTHKRRKQIGNESWTYWAIVIILLLIVISFFVIRMFLKK